MRLDQQFERALLIGGILFALVIVAGILVLAATQRKAPPAPAPTVAPAPDPPCVTCAPSYSQHATANLGGINIYLPGDAVQGWPAHVWLDGVAICDPHYTPDCYGFDVGVSRAIFLDVVPGTYSRIEVAYWTWDGCNMVERRVCVTGEWRVTAWCYGCADVGHPVRVYLQ
jgi:hypothetical protein